MAAVETAGVVLPADEDGRRSSTGLGRAVVADALAPVDPIGAEAARRASEWRSGYVPHLRRLVEAGLTDGSAAVAIAEAGLNSLHHRMRVVTATGAEVPLADAFDQPVHQRLTTRSVVGSAPVDTFTLPVSGRRLEDETLLLQLDLWEQRGALEPSAAEAVRELAHHPDWLPLQGTRVVVLGAGAEMGPLQALLSWGAEVIAVDLPRPDLWRRLEKLASASAGVLHIPEIDGRPGADLLHDLPAVAEWLETFEGPLVVGNYAYADGAANLRLSMATDALALRLTARRNDVSLAYLATPTDVFGVPTDVIEFSAAAYDRARVKGVRSVLKAASGGRLLQRNYRPGPEPGVADAVIPQQGPNYLLAKRVQRWRATVARRAGVPVSLLVAPPTRTRSVTKNRALAAAYAGAHHFGVEVFNPSTSNVLMAGLLVHDLRNGGAPVTEPWREEAAKAVSGGLWRGPYAPRSALGLAFMLGWGVSRA
ncbi:hypothetical protein [Granulicoccus sp. GXG6511]|uniref:hypothetical protein n=1 Tax=Granulicoccus sp. GXG6511 TaxID=3381351 RepID=UPI003D7E1A50